MPTAPSLTDHQLLQVLRSYKNAIAIYSSQDIVIEHASDAMIAFWKKDRSVIGKRLADAVPELQGQPFIGMLQEVLRTGIDNIGKGIKANFEVDGGLQTFYFDYEYLAVKDEHGKPYCILHTAEDVTERELGRLARQEAQDTEMELQKKQKTNEQLAALNEELFDSNAALILSQDNLLVLKHDLEARVEERTQALMESESRLRFIIRDAPVGIAVFTGPEMVIEAANKKVLEAWGKPDSIVGKPLRIAVPELVGQNFIDLLDSVYTSGRSFKGDEVMSRIERNEHIEEVYANFVYHPLKDEKGNTISVMLVTNDVTDQVNARKAVEESEKQTRFMLNAIPQQVWTASPDGRLDYVNQVVCDDFGHSLEDVIAHGWREFIHPDDLPKALKKWEDALRSNSEYLVEYRLRFHDGTYKWHLGRAHPFAEQGTVKAWFGTNTNIELQKGNELRKDEFISIASHELKTPLTSIKAFNQLMKRVSDKEKLHSFIERSSDHIQRLERLIGDLLDVTRINAGKMVYASEPFDFRQMLVNSIETAQHTTTTHRIELLEECEVEYTGDQHRLEQVMNNFLTNAIKYSPQADKIIVRCTIQKGHLVVSVQDFGVGIAPANIDKLFDRYYRVDNTAMRFEGLGLGLFIASEILTRHKGNLWLESTEGKGSTFYFRLPLYADELTEVKTDVYYSSPNLTIVVNEPKKRIELDWTGLQTFDTVKAGCLIALDMIITNGCTSVLNDNRHLEGSWSEASDWAGETYFPMLDQAGIRDLAWVYSPIVFNQLAAQRTVNVFVGNIRTQFFTDIDLAAEWLNEGDAISG